MSGFWLEYEGKRLPLRGGDTLIGRSPYCTIVIPDPSVSREHAVIHLGPEGLVLEDRGARNGTFLNGTRLTEPRKIELGDLVGIGRAVLQLVSVEWRRRSSPRATPTLGYEEVEEVDLDPKTAPQSLFDYLEPMLGRAFEPGRPPDIFDSVRNLVDAILGEVQKKGQRLTRAEASRIVAVADVVAAWSEDKSLLEWRDRVFHLLEDHRPGVTTAGRKP